MADVARTEIAVYLFVAGEPTFEWCDQCQFSEMAVFPITILSDWGVTTGGTYRRCLRCYPLEADDG